MRTFVVAALVGGAAMLGLAGTTSCGGGGPPTIDCTKTPPKKYSELTIIAKCTNCHSNARTQAAIAQFGGTGWAADPNNAALPDPTAKVNLADGGRHGATPGYDYDTYDAIKMVDVHIPEDDLAGGGPSFLHTMPPTNFKIDGGAAAPLPTATELTDFYAWAQCGEPN